MLIRIQTISDGFSTERIERPLGPPKKCQKVASS